MDSRANSNITEKLIHLNLADNLIEDLDVKVTKRYIRAVKSHWHDFYEMELILSGDTKTEINGKIYSLPQGSMVLVTPSDVHSYFDMGRDVEVLNLVFASKSLEYNSFASSVLSGDSIVCKLPPKAFESMQFLINKISEESRTDRLLNKRYISNLLSCLIIELKRIKKEEGISENGDAFNTVRKAIVFIRNHFKEPLTLEDVAKFMNVSPVYASRIIQATLGYGFKEYLMDLRLAYAASMLIYTEESISNIAYFAGYNTASYFARGFRKKYGVSPAEYRRQKRKEANPEL